MLRKEEKCAYFIRLNYKREQKALGTFFNEFISFTKTKSPEIISSLKMHFPP